LKRFIDKILSFFLIATFALPFLLIIFLIKLSTSGKILYWSDRVGLNNVIFRMPKFRTMVSETPQIATHLLANPDTYLTPVGSFLRRNSLDELPQLWSILIGDMSFVGPRPALFNQDDLVKLRTEIGVHKLKPGLTGWAQINGRDKLSIHEKVLFDKYYLDNQSILLDFKIILKTFIKVVHKDGINH
jgi:O-antigen biosynthesis protein WbqP